MVPAFLEQADGRRIYLQNYKTSSKTLAIFWATNRISQIAETKYRDIWYRRRKKTYDGRVYMFDNQTEVYRCIGIV